MLLFVWQVLARAMPASSDLTSILMATDTLVGKCTPPQTVLVSCIQVVVWLGNVCVGPSAQATAQMCLGNPTSNVATPVPFIQVL